MMKRLSLRGFIIDDYYSQADEYRVQLASWLEKGEITCKEVISDGLEQAPAKFVGMLRGDNFGKTLIRVSNA